MSLPGSETDFDTESIPDYLDINFYKDPRVLWIKDRILTFIRMRDEDNIFYTMLEENDNKAKLAAFLCAKIQNTDLTLDRRTFFICKIIVDKLIHEDKEFTEWSKFICLLLNVNYFYLSSPPLSQER